MATYKVIQDIEAEDHILGPLSLRQFIYALISAFCLYISFICLTKHAAYLLVLFLPPALFTGFFAFPFGKDQPTEVWALAKIRFLFKPRRRIWDQSGIKELVTITVPKKIERVLTNGLSQDEVQSRLKALANTIDSRGWAIKNVNVNLYSQPNPLLINADSDRLIDINNMPHEVPSYDVQASDDMLDEASNPVAQQFDQLISASSQNHHQELIDRLNSARAASATPQTGAGWFMGKSAASPATTVDPLSLAASTQTPSADEEVLAAQIKARNSTKPNVTSHMHTLKPRPGDSTAPASQTNTNDAGQPAATTTDAKPANNASTATTTNGSATTDAAILSLAGNNDLNVATLAREANKAKHLDDDSGEVVISLH